MVYKQDMWPLLPKAYTNKFCGLSYFFFHFVCFRLNCKGKTFREEPKAIVFLSKLLMLFQACHLCFAKNPLLSVAQSGTMLTITSTCSQRKESISWTSQPYMLGKFPAENLLLSFAILCSGASINNKNPTCVPAHGGTCLSVFYLLLPSTTFAGSFHHKVLARPPGWVD